MTKIIEKTINLYKHLENLKIFYSFGVRELELISKNELIIKHKFNICEHAIPVFSIPELKTISDEDVYIEYTSFDGFVSGIKLKYDDDIAHEIFDYYFYEIQKEIDEKKEIAVEIN